MEVLESVELDRLAELRERDEFFWLDLTNPSAEDMKAVGESLGLHPVAIEDTLEFGQRPKLDAYGDHLLFVFYTVRRGPDTGESAVEPVEVHIYISGSYVVTVRRSTCTELDELHEELDTADPKAEHYIVYRIFDVLTDAFYPMIELLEEHIDAIEAQRAARKAPARAARRDLPRSSRTSRSSRDASSPSATASSPARRRSSTCPGWRAGRRSTCATSATTCLRSPASCTASRRTSRPSPRRTSTPTRTASTASPRGSRSAARSSSPGRS